MLKILIVSLGLTLALGCAGSGPGGTTSETTEVAAIADTYLQAYYDHFPEALTYRSIPGAPHDRLTDISALGRAEWSQIEDDLLTQLREINHADLWGTPDWITYGFLLEELEAAVASRICRMELWQVNQLSGWQVSFSNLAGVQPVGSDEHRVQALDRWRQIPAYLEQIKTNLREGLSLGYSMPRRNVELVITQLDELASMSAEESPYFSPAKRDSTAEFVGEWTVLVADILLPAVADFSKFLTSDYLPHARAEMGVSSNPDGETCYKARYRSYTTLDRDPAGVVELGKSTVAANREKMIDLAVEIWGTEDVDKVMEELLTDPANRFSSRDDLWKFAERGVARGKEAVPDWFGLVPESEVVLEAIPAFAEATAGASYRRAAADGSRPARYRINLSKPEEQLKSSTERTAIHEAYPGHHLQIAIGAEYASAHKIAGLLGNSGFIEGWARYAENLAEEMGLYQSDYARIGRLGWPARGMVVDPGIHLYGWTRQQSVDYMMASGTMPEDRAERMVDRIMGWPAQLTAYDSGALELFALRQLAEERLGDNFDIREFHSQLLGDGSLTLRMARQKIERWLDQAK